MSAEFKSQADEDALDQGFYDIPSPRVRARMSPDKLAILLSQQKADTPAYILVEHELNLRIAGVQSRATLRSGWLGLLGALLGAVLGFFLGTLSPKEVKQELFDQACRYQCEAHIQTNNLTKLPMGTLNPNMGKGNVVDKLK